ncbi:RTA1 like protein-domain-containing protein [Aspergillus aurantiobrunneus]
MDPATCSLETCPIEDAYIQYQPTIPGNSVYIALFGALLIAQTLLCPVYRMWGFSGSMITGLILEVLGYAARILFHDDPFSMDYFLMNLISLSLGPVFFCAALYFLLGRIVVVHQGEDISRLRPRNYAIVFVSCDVVALILQSVGGALTSMAEDNASRETGVNVMIAGLAFQVAALTLFIFLAVEFAYRVRRRSTVGESQSKGELARVRQRKLWKAFLACMALATLTVYTRSIFRVIELNGGFDSELANDELAFMVLEGAMVSITCICLTVVHPGMALRTRHRRGEQLLDSTELD